jgi:hemerythrin-like metal-binding protein
MARLAWRPEYSVGDPAVDHEHQELIDLVNQTADAIEAGEGADRIDRSFGDLLRSVSSHFALEERQMREAAYDRLTEHKADHERLIDALRDIMDRAAVLPERSSERLVATLDAWFADHFRTHDARLHRRLGPHDHP